MVNSLCAVCLVGTYNISSLHMHCSDALKQSQGDPNRCWMVVLSWVHRGLFSLKVISSRSHITTHFDVIAYSCGWQISEIRSPVDIWKASFLRFKFCWFSATWEKLILKSNIHIKTVYHFIGVNWGRAWGKREEKTKTQLFSSVGAQG